MRVGILVEGEDGVSWDAWRRIAARVDALGFDALWRSDHLLSIVDENREAHDTWTALAVAATVTHRVQLGALVSPITVRHPAMLAKIAASVDTLSAGRLVLGLGAGWNEREHRAYGLAFPPLRERLERLEESIEVILRLQGPGPASYQGRHYSLDAVDAYPKPVQTPHVPLLIGGKGNTRLLRIVARYADEWNLTTNSPAFYRERAAALAEQCCLVGRDPATIRRSVTIGVLIGRHARELERRCHMLQRLIPRLAAYNAAAVPEALQASGWVCGTPAAIVRQLAALAAAGIDRVMLQHNDCDDDDALELIAREVIPAVA